MPPITHSQQVIQNWIDRSISAAVADFNAGSSRYVDVTDYGAVADNSTDNHTPFLEAIDQGLAIGNPRICVPGGLGIYRFDEPLIIDHRIELFGDGEQSTLLFPNMAGIKITSGLADSTIIRNLTILGNTGGVSEGYNDDTEHGIFINSAKCIVEGVSVYNFSGDGIFVYGDVGGGTNANLFDINRVTIYNCGRAGLHFLGGDGNSGGLMNYDAQGCGRFGGWAEEFLGNGGINGHHSANAVGHNYNKTVVRHIVGGITKYWWAIDDSIGVEPGVTSGWAQVWKQWNGLFFLQDWADDVQYYRGCAFFADGFNHRGKYINIYSEGDELGLINHSSTTFDCGYLPVDHIDSSPTRRGIIYNEHGTIVMNDSEVVDRANGIRNISHGAGYNNIGFSDDDNALSIAWKYNKANKSIGLAQNDTVGAIELLSNLSDPAPLGRDVAPAGMGVFKDIGLYRPNANNNRAFGSRDVVPSSDDHGAGEFFINTGTDESITAWKRKTDDTWQVLREGTPDITATPITATGGLSPTKPITTRLINCTSGSIVLTITPAFAGQIINLKRIDASANTITIALASGNIDGAANATLDAQYDSKAIMWDGANGWITNSQSAPT